MLELTENKINRWGRRIGRDVFDLHQANALLENPTLVRKMAIYYFYRSRIVYDPSLLRASFEETRGTKAAYRGDVATFLRADTGFAIDEALAEMPVLYEFIFDLDESDNEFILLARHLLGKLGAKRAATALKSNRPLTRLFQGQSGISPNALALTRDDLALHDGG